MSIQSMWTWTCYKFFFLSGLDKDYKCERKNARTAMKRRKEQDHEAYQVVLLNSLHSFVIRFWHEFYFENENLIIIDYLFILLFRMISRWLQSSRNRRGGCPMKVFFRWKMRRSNLKKNKKTLFPVKVSVVKDQL